MSEPEDLNSFYADWKQRRDNWIVEHGNFNGHRNPDQHRTTGTRAWCECGTWCYPEDPCPCCREQMADENPCPHCDGTGVAGDPEGESARPVRTLCAGTSTSSPGRVPLTVRQRADGAPVATANICVDPSPVHLVTDLRWDANYLAATSVPTKGALLRISFRASRAADRIEKLEAELERTRQAWVNGDDPDCEDVCLTECKGPCEGKPRPVDLASDDRLIPLPGGRVAVAAQDLQVGDVVGGWNVREVQKDDGVLWVALASRGITADTSYADGTLVLLDKAAES